MSKETHAGRVITDGLNSDGFSSGKIGTSSIDEGVKPDHIADGMRSKYYERGMYVYKNPHFRRYDSAGVDNKNNVESVTIDAAEMFMGKENFLGIDGINKLEDLLNKVDKKKAGAEKKIAFYTDNLPGPAFTKADLQIAKIEGAEEIVVTRSRRALLYGKEVGLSLNGVIKIFNDKSLKVRGSSIQFKDHEKYKNEEFAREPIKEGSSLVTANIVSGSVGMLLSTQLGIIEDRKQFLRSNGAANLSVEPLSAAEIIFDYYLRGANRENGNKDMIGSTLVTRNFTSKGERVFVGLNKLGPKIIIGDKGNLDKLVKDSGLIIQR